MGNYSNLLLYFAIYSFFGWMLETIFASVKQRKFINRGFLTGFFCPIYGIGAVLVMQCSRWVNTIIIDYSKSLIIGILFSILLVTTLEYITGLLLEKIFKCKWWDYGDNAANLQGYICIKYSLIWGLLAFVLVQVVHPVIWEIVCSIPVSIKGYVATFLSLYFLVDTAKSGIDVLNLREVILNYSIFPVNNYHKKIFQYKRFFLAFPRLLILNAGIINRDVRSILNDRFDKIKIEIKNRFQ